MPKITCFKGHPLESAFNKKIAQGVEEYQAANEVISEQYNTIVDNLNALREGLNVPKLEKIPLDIKAKIEVLEGQIQRQLAEVDAQKLPVEEKSKFVPQNKEVTKLVTEYLRAKLGQAINILPETEMLVELRKRGYAKPLSINEKVYGFYDQLSKETYLTEEFLSSESLVHELYHSVKPNIKEKAAKGDKTAKLLLQKMNDLVIESGFNEKEAIDRYQTAKREELDFNAMIIGSGAVQLNNSLQEAKQLENEGLSEVEIEDRTGWYKQNGQWKMFSKEVAKNFDINKENVKVNQEQTLEEILTNEDIFNYYPQLRKVKIVFYDKLLQDKESVLPKQRNEVGGFTKYGNGKGQSVYVNTFYKQGGQRTDSDIRRTLGHEITHLIQDIEGFPKGGDNLSVLREALTITSTPDGLTAKQLKENLSNFDTKGLTENEKSIIENAIKAVNYISKNQTSKLQEQYTYLFGEVEARAVESVVSNKENVFLNSNQLYTDYFNKFLGSQGIKESDTYKLRNGDISFSTPEDLAKEYTERITAIKQAKPQDYWSVDIPSQEIIQKAAQEGRIARNEGGMAIVTEDGNMVGLFKDGEGKNISEDLDKKRLSLGGIKKDNFDGYLTKLYKSRGFRVVSRVPFNETYAPKGWNKELHGTPDVVAMIYDPQNKLKIEEKTFESYDEAMAYRDSFVDEAKVLTKDGRVDFMIVGEKGVSKLSNSIAILEDLKVAKEMQKGGASPKIIRITTGWEYNNTEKKWKTEIQDGSFKDVTPTPNTKDVNFENDVFKTNLSDIYSNDELFKAYPELRETKVVVYETTNQLDENEMFYSIKNNTIYINGKSNRLNFSDPKNTTKSNLYHEVQHVIQTIEGFARGGSPTGMSKSIREALTKIREDYNKGIDGATKGDNFSEYLKKAIIDKFGKEKADVILQTQVIGSSEIASLFSDDFYKNLAGEVEARNTQTRANIPLQQRLTMLLRETEDVSEKDKLYLQSTGVDFMIIGEKGASRLSNAVTVLENLVIAKEMQKNNYSPKMIKMSTGWEYNNTEKKWKTETEDIKIKDVKVELGKEYNYSDIIEENEFTKAYPNIKDIKIIFNNDGRNIYSKDRGVIELDTFGEADLFISREKNITNPERLREGAVHKLQPLVGSSIVHEFHHYIAREENFSSGGSPNIILQKAAELSGITDEDTTDIAESKIRAAISETTNANDLKILNSALEFLNGNPKAFYKAYENIAGEVDARNVSKRLSMPLSLKLQSLLSETEDVAEEDKIYLKDSLESYNISQAYAPRQGETQDEYVDRMKEEVEANLLGENSEQYFEKIAKENNFTEKEKISFINKVKEFIKSFADWLAKQIGFENLTPEQANQLTNKDILDRVTTSILKGQYKNSLFEDLSQFNRIPVMEVVEGKLMPKKENKVEETIKATLQDDEKGVVRQTLSDVERISPQTWQSSPEAVKTLLRNIEKKAIQISLDLKGLENSYDTKSQAEILSLVRSLDFLLNNPTEANQQNFIEVYEDFMGVVKEDAVAVEKVPEQFRDKPVVKLETKDSEYKVFLETGLLKIGKDTYIKTDAKRKTLEQVEALLAANKLEIDESKMSDIVTNDAEYSLDEVKKLIGYKTYFKTDFKEVEEIRSVPQIADKNLKTDFISEVRKQQLGNPDNKVLQNLEFSDKGITLKYTDPISVIEMNDYLKTNEDLKNYFTLSKNTNFELADVETAEFNERDYLVNGGKKENIKEFRKVNNETVIVKTSEDFITIEQDNYERTYGDFFSKLPNSDSNFYETNVEKPALNINPKDYNIQRVEAKVEVNNQFTQKESKIIDEIIDCSK